MCLKRRLKGTSNSIHNDFDPRSRRFPLPGFKQTFDHAFFPLFGDHLSLSMVNFTDFLTDTLDSTLLINDSCSGREAGEA